MVRIKVRGSYRVNEIAWSEKVYRVASEVWLGGVAGKGGSPKSPRKLSSQAEGSPVSGGYREAQAPTSLLMFSVPLLLYISDSAGCHSLMSSFTSGRGGGSGGPP